MNMHEPAKALWDDCNDLDFKKMLRCSKLQGVVSFSADSGICGAPHGNAGNVRQEFMRLDPSAVGVLGVSC